MGVLHVVLPGDIDDPATPSGGNVYDRRVCDGLAALGWRVVELAVRGAWPVPTPAERAGLRRVLAAIPDDALVLIDGLIASAVADVLVPEAGRLRLVVLVLMPLGGRGETAVLQAARAVITMSSATRRLLREEHGPLDVQVAAPGVDPAPEAPGSDAGAALLCVAAVARHKGHDLLADALARIGEAPWRCVCVGSLTREPAFVAGLRGSGLQFVGPLVGADLAAAYAAADLLVLPSRGETYGMVVTEALARGIPVLATRTGGIPEALGTAPDGSLPGMLVEPGDPAALAGALRGWLGDRGLRARLRQSARARRTTLTGWATTAELVSTVLKGVSA
jgi:glycosyltransferase involved in cell wall biosynthesis